MFWIDGFGNIPFKFIEDVQGSQSSSYQQLLLQILGGRKKNLMYLDYSDYSGLQSPCN